MTDANMTNKTVVGLCQVCLKSDACEIFKAGNEMCEKYGIVYAIPICPLFELDEKRKNELENQTPINSGG